MRRCGGDELTGRPRFAHSGSRGKHLLPEQAAVRIPPCSGASGARSRSTTTHRQIGTRRSSIIVVRLRRSETDRSALPSPVPISPLRDRGLGGARDRVRRDLGRRRIAAGEQHHRRPWRLGPGWRRSARLGRGRTLGVGGTAGRVREACASHARGAQSPWAARPQRRCARRLARGARTGIPTNRGSHTCPQADDHRRRGAAGLRGLRHRRAMGRGPARGGPDRDDQRSRCRARGGVTEAGRRPRGGPVSDCRMTTSSSTERVCQCSFHRAEGAVLR